MLTDCELGSTSVMTSNLLYTTDGSFVNETSYEKVFVVGLNPKLVYPDSSIKFLSDTFVWRAMSLNWPFSSSLT